jgi:MraZ protein
VVSFVFQGGSALTLDGKGRMTVPARHRDVLSAVANDQLTVTKHPNRCLLLFPRPAWEQFRDKILAMSMGGDALRRLFVGSAMDVEIDGGSRVLIAPELRAWAGLDREVMLLGTGQRFEIWDKARLDAHEDEMLKNELPTAFTEMVM